MNFSFFAKLILLTLVALVIIFVIDPLDPSTASSPFLLGMILMALSLRQGTALVLATVVIYSVLTFFDLLAFIDYVQANMHPVKHPYFWLFQRMGLFLVICSMATYLASYRANTLRILVHVQNVLAKLPAPVLISDAAGSITYANDALGPIFKQKAYKLTGKRYIDFLMTDIQEAKAQRYYIELFNDLTNRVQEIELALSENQKIKARLTCLGSGADRVMITVFNILPSHELFEYPASSQAEPAARG